MLPHLRPRQLPAVSLALVLAILGPLPHAAAQEAPDQPPADIGMREEVGITLMILDIDARDRSGRPIPGLTKDDFELFLGPRSWEIYAVDDLCPCSSGASGVQLTGGGAAPSTGQDAGAAAGLTDRSGAVPPGEAAAVIADDDPSLAAGALAGRHLQRRYVLYFDFSQLRADGRDRAFEASRRWLTETKRPDDLVQIVAFVSAGGIKPMTGFISDREHLLRVLDAAEQDMAYVDTFPMQFFMRLADCHGCIKECAAEGTCRDPRGCDACCMQCTQYAHDELHHSQRSLRALRRYLGSLDALPGRTELMLLHQNNTIFPARFYRMPPSEADFEIGTSMQLLEEVGAAATAAGARVHALSTEAHRGFRPPISDAAANFGANFADYTGGTYSQASSDLAVLMDRAVTDCSCRYRISFEPPDVDKTRMYNARVFIRGERLPYSFRVEQVTKGMRLFREAVAILDFPGSRNDFPVHVSLVPTRRTKKGWDVQTAVLVELDALSFTDDQGTLEVQLDVGAILYPRYEYGGGKAHEMLGGSQVRVRDSDALDRWLLHWRGIAGLPGGDYRLAGYIRNAAPNTYGGAETFVELPKVGKPALVGPFLYQTDCTYYETGLPLMRKDVTPSQDRAAVSRGPLPSAPALPRGSQALFVTWSCAPLKKPMDLESERVVRHIVQNGIILDTLAAPHYMEAEENCLKVVDSLDTSRLEPGSYSYLILKEPAEDAPGLTGQIAFQVEPD